MKKLLLSIVFSVFYLISFSQTNIKTMFYNMLNFPSSFQIADDLNRLNRIVNNYQPDLFLVAEITSPDVEQLVLQKVLTTSNYKAVTYQNNTSGTPPFNNLQQFAFYNADKLLLVKQGVIKTYLRDINHYTFKLNTLDQDSNPILIEVFVAHLKASNTDSDKSNRNAMINDFFTAVNNGLIAPNSFVLFSGDLNLYASSEPAYQNLLNPQHAIKIVDPINNPGDWTSNSTFQGIHTQSTRLNSIGDSGATGGLDDRFDFILMSENLQNHTNLSYVPNSYKAYGNNGNCFDKSINNTSCTGTFSQQLRDDLYYFSDHLPVVMELYTSKLMHVNYIDDTTLSLPDNTNLNSIVKNLEVVNAAGKSFTYTILSGNEQGTFSLNATSGLLTTAKHLNYTQQQKYTLTIAINDGTQTDTATLTILIQETADADNDGITDSFDLCPNTPIGSYVDYNGCTILPATNFSISVTSPTCQTKSNGKITITAISNYTYVGTLDGVTYNFTNNSLEIPNLAAKNYSLCIDVPGLPNLKQCFEITINQATGLNGRTSIETINNKSRVAIEIETGTAPYTLFVNNTIIGTTYEKVFSTQVQHGDTVEIKSSLACEGTLKKQILLDDIWVYPNPIKDFTTLLVTDELLNQHLTISLVNTLGKVVFTETVELKTNNYLIDLSHIPSGIYYLTIQGKTTKTVKLIKQ